MNWITITILAYFLGALAIILDKFLLGSKRVSSPWVYSFYIGLLGLAVIVFAPIGFFIPSGLQVLISLLSGILFTLGILSLYFAIQKAEASRVAPVVGAVIPLAAYFFSLLFFGEILNLVQILGIALLIFGGLLISFDLPLKINKKKFFSGFYHSILAGVLMAGAFTIFKYIYQEQGFINGFIWTRFGAFIGVLGFFLVPQWRRDIINSFSRIKRPGRKGYQTGAIFFIDKIFGGLSSILLNYAFAIGSITLVNSMVSIQYVFVLFLVALASMKYPAIFGEKLYFWDWAQKVAAIIVIGLGIYLVSRPSGLVLF